MSHDPGLFPEPDAQAREHLEALGRAIAKAMPLRAKHRSDLAYAIRDLSRSLTEEREGRPKDYMGEPRFASAYLRYFMPWNLYRLTRLFQGLQLDIPDGGTVIDLGAGPLTAMLALWIARPHLRGKKLAFVCLDRTPRPMKTGLDIFRRLAPESPWKISLVKGSVHTKVRERADLLMAVNTLNELDWKGGEAVHDQAEQTARSLTQRLNHGGKILLVEPGVRDAARLLTLLRGALIGSGYTPLAPCPHALDCAMPGEATGPWCHFRFEALSAPVWLKQLTDEARLTKQAASLSFVYLSPTQDTDGDAAGANAEPSPKLSLVRAISQPFTVPEGQGQYACSDQGLTLLGYRHGQSPLQPGAALRPRWPAAPTRDEKSGAVILPVAPAPSRPGKSRMHTIDPGATKRPKRGRKK